MKKYKTVIIGSAHVHILEVAKYCSENENIDLLACADTKPGFEVMKREVVYGRKWNLNYVKKNYDLKVYDDYIEMLDSIKPDFAIITSENALHSDIVKDCSRRGIAVSVEKPMAVTLSEGLKMYRETRINNTLLMINWPIAWRPYYYQIKELLAEDKIGELKRIRSFTGNTGGVGKGVKHRGVSEFGEEITEKESSTLWWHKSAYGGGAMLDFCSYGCLASYWLIKKPAIAATGMRCNLCRPWGDVEDNAGMIVMFPECIATIEGTWMIHGNAVPPGPEIHGTKGSIFCERVGDEVKLKLIDINGKEQWIEPMDSKSMPKDIADVYVRYMNNGEALPEMVDMDCNLSALAILDAGIRSTKSGKSEIVRNIEWNIG